MTTADSLFCNLKLEPVISLGVLVGRWMRVRVSQGWFERVVLAFAFSREVSFYYSLSKNGAIPQTFSCWC